MVKKYKVSKKVVLLVKKIQKHILEEPKRFNMSHYVSTVKEVISNYSDDEEWNEEVLKRYPSCGTTACIAGWATILSHKVKKDKKGWLILKKSWDDCSAFARKALQLDTSMKFSEGDNYSDYLLGNYKGKAIEGNMFHKDSWPQPYRAQYQKEYGKIHPNKTRLAKIACARLEHYLTTGR